LQAVNSFYAAIALGSYLLLNFAGLMLLCIPFGSKPGIIGIGVKKFIGA